jgi:hypothetical protein
MKAINDLYESLARLREERRNYRIIGDLPHHIANDIGLHVDHDARRAYRS